MLLNALDLITVVTSKICKRHNWMRRPASPYNLARRPYRLARQPIQLIPPQASPYKLARRPYRLARQPIQLGLPPANTYRLLILKDQSITNIHNQLNYRILQHSNERNYRLNLTLSRVHKWGVLNGISINIDKTEFMVFHKKGDLLPTFPNPSINSHELRRVDRFRYPGLVFDSHFSFSFNPHFRLVKHRLSSMLGRLRNVSKFLTPRALIQFWNKKTPYSSFGIRKSLIPVLE